MNENAKISAIDIYISEFPDNVQQILLQIRKNISKLEPEATELMSYGIPTFDLNKKHLIHYAGYKNHIGIYPGPSTIEFFKDKLTGYETSKGAIKLPLDKPIPYELITLITKYNIAKLK